MPFNNYSELVDEVVDLVGRSRLRTKVPGFIQLAEAEAVLELRDLRQVRFKTNGTLTAGDESLTLADNVRGIDLFQLDEVPVRTVRATSIDLLVERRALETAAADKFPTVYAWVGENVIEMAPTPQANTPYTLYHTRGMLDVNSDKLTSNILEEAPHYLMYRAAYHVALYTRNAEQEARFGRESANALLAYGRYLARKDKDSLQVGRNVSPRDYPQTTGSF